jgi:hypothetical protein
MSLSLHIAQGNARRVAGKKGPAKVLAADQRVAGAMRLGLITRKLSAVTNIRKRAGRRITTFRRL